MPYAGEHVTAALRAARVEKGLTQRELSERVGLPQSHISRIESGAVDLQLSNLIELARVLDLEIMPVPRKFVPAVETIVQSGESRSRVQAENTRRAANELKSIQDTAKRLLTFFKNSKHLARIQQTAAELMNVPFSDRELKEIRNISAKARRIAESKDELKIIQGVDRDLHALRNLIVHEYPRPTPAVMPAYTLGEDDDA